MWNIWISDIFRSLYVSPLFLIWNTFQQIPLACTEINLLEHCFFVVKAPEKVKQEFKTKDSAHFRCKAFVLERNKRLGQPLELKLMFRIQGAVLPRSLLWMSTTWLPESASWRSGKGVFSIWLCDRHWKWYQWYQRYACCLAFACLLKD